MEPTVVERNYKPTKKAEEFHSSDCFVQVLVGGMGSGKSRAVIQEIEQSGLEWPKMPIAVYRKTMPSLRDSTLQEFENHVTPGVGHYKVREDQFEFHNGSFINFRGLDDPNKTKSTEYGLIVMEEADEFTREDLLFLKGRVRKKGPWPLRIVLVLNPCDENHWIYKEFVLNKAAYESTEAGGLMVLHLSTYDNIENLPKNYIEQNTAGMTPEEIERYVFGKWGSIVKGEPVYKKYLNPQLHIARWDYAPGMLLYRGWDFGFNHPACSFRLVDQLGRKNCAFSMIGDKEDLDIFASKVINQTKLRFPDAQVRDFGDPRGHDKHAAASSKHSSTAFEVLQDLGIYATGERGSREYVEKGIKEVRREFQTLIAGVPELTIDPGNTLLINAYINGKYVRDETGAVLKDGFYEHIADADRYIPHNTKVVSAVKEAIEKRNQSKSSFTPRNRFTGYR